MTADVDGTSMREGSLPRVLVTGGSGFTGRRVVRALLDEGAVIVDIPAARSLGYQPAADLKSGLPAVWPEFSEAAL